MKSFFLILSFLIGIILISCKSKKEDQRICIYQKTDKTPGNTYPFNAADKIEIVSYDIRPDTTDELIRNGKFIVPIDERISLDQARRDSLFSLLYDYTRNKKAGPVRYADCYNPRHAVIFYKEEKAIAFWEICLECGGQRQSPNTGFESFCHENACEVQHFFVNAGIKNVIHEQCK